MKKILIALGALGVMSFTTNQILHTYQLSEAINNVQDMKEWMKEDIHCGIIDEKYGETYIEWLNETEDLLIDFYNVNTTK